MVLQKKTLYNLAAAVAIFALFSGCEKPTLKPPPVKKESKPEKRSIPKIRYPVSRLISDSQGRETEVSIIGKSGVSIVFLRASDGARFTFPISKLSEKDRKFVSSLARRSAPEEEKIVLKPEKPNYIVLREKELERLNRKRDDLEKKLK